MGPLVGLHPGANTPLLRWPKERFSELADALIERWDARVVLTGGEAERELTNEISDSAHASLLHLAGQTALGTFAALLCQLDRFVANDTGGAHVAAVAGTSSVVLFVTTPPYQWAPLGDDRHLVVDARTYSAPQFSPVETLPRAPVGPVLLACARHFDRVCR